MKKILILSLGFILLSSCVAFAQTASTTLVSPTPTLVTTNTTLTTQNLQCVQNAVKTREAAIASALSTFFVSTTTSLANRASALDTAWGMTNNKERREARNAAWSTYKKSTQDARKIFRTSKKAAWDMFKSTSLKTCKTPVVENEVDDNIPL